MFMENTGIWAKKIFSTAKLGDTRRTKRLISLASSLAEHIGQSLVQSLKCPADIEAAYRFARNQNINAQAIAEAGFNATMEHAQEYNCLLAIEDTTSLEFCHDSVNQEMGYTTSSHSKKAKGMHVHSVLLFAPEQQHIVGLIEQSRWVRDIKKYGKKHQRATRPYEEKESYKWESASVSMAERFGPQIDKVISVCDREADIIEYLSYKTSQKQRFIVRSAHSRCLDDSQEKLYTFSESLKAADTRVVEVAQKGGRKQRHATCEVFYAPVSIKVPQNKIGEAISLYYVCCREINNPSGLCWHILTSEPIKDKETAHSILNYYEKRWLIEEFHKAWKSGGTKVESLRMQSKDNLERILVILAFIAVRIHQLRYLGLNQQEAKKQHCENILSPIAWKLLWTKVEKKAIPKQVPSIHWAYMSLGKLAGWNDSKQTGRVGWTRLWEGWFLLQTILDGYLLSTSLEL